MLMVLISGHLVMFRVAKNRTSFLHHSKTINLLDAQIYSGQLAVTLLPRGSERRGSVTPRRYADGLEASDEEEDNTFLLWSVFSRCNARVIIDFRAKIYRYRSHAPGWRHEDRNTVQTQEKVPQLDGAQTFHVFKARSKLERDAWCWAINCEIERVVRAAKEREDKVRNTGRLA